MSSPKKHYLVVECTKCKRFLLANAEKRTRTCPYCGKRLSIQDAKVLVHSESAEKARLALQELKVQDRGGRSN
jgi:DNA-directed RNA polymerase subunit RPC12/RpoP